VAVSPKLVGGQYVWLNSLFSAPLAGGGESAGKRHLAHIGKRLPADTPKRRRDEIETSFIRRAKSPADRLP
jgi:hypothetical protein